MDEIVYAHDRALSLSLALQPEFATQFLLNRQFEAQGLIPRSLISFPRPALYEPSSEPPANLPREDYYARLEEILDLAVAMDETLGNLAFRHLTMTSKAQNLVKRLQQSSRKLAFNNADNMQAHHKRTAEQVIRLSGILAVMDGNDHVESCHVERATELEAYYRQEWAWMRAKLQANGDHGSEALQLWNWMKARKEAAGVDRFVPGDINRSGPRMCRNQTQLTQALVNELIDRGYIRRDGSCVEMRPANPF
jgi:hypothetical protein